MCDGNEEAPSSCSLVQNDTFQHRAPVQTSQTGSLLIHYSKQLLNSLIFSSTNWLIPHTINLPMSFEGILTNQMHIRAQWIYSLVAICGYGNTSYPQTKPVAQRSFFPPSVFPSNLPVLLVCQHFSIWLLGVSWVRGRMHASLAQTQQRLGFLGKVSKTKVMEDFSGKIWCKIDVKVMRHVGRSWYAIKMMCGRKFVLENWHFVSFLSLPTVEIHSEQKPKRWPELLLRYGWAAMDHFILCVPLFENCQTRLPCQLFWCLMDFKVEQQPSAEVPDQGLKDREVAARHAVREQVLECSCHSGKE